MIRGLLLLSFVFAGCCDPDFEPGTDSAVVIVCETVCDDPAFPIVCRVERPEGTVWTCAEDADTCESVPGEVCE